MRSLWHHLHHVMALAVAAYKHRARMFQLSTLAAVIVMHARSHSLLIIISRGVARRSSIIALSRRNSAACHRRNKHRRSRNGIGAIC